MSDLPFNSLAFALLAAARIDAAVLAGQSLADGLLARVDAVARPAVQDLVYGSLRQYGHGDFLLARLLAARGVQVNVTVAGFGGRNFSADFLPRLTEAGVRAMIYRPEIGRFHMRRHRLAQLGIALAGTGKTDLRRARAGVRVR